MVRPLYRSHSHKRIYRRTPGGRTVVHYERRKNTPMRCGRCGAILAGVPVKEHERRCLPKTAKRPERPFGGVLCPRCLRAVLKKVIRSSTSVAVPAPASAP
uniref:Large ribosomal subunit protein eL34 n=1 Tax=Ignisphaera aggregans TaxID=334771 RepID=A0A7C2ZQP2_9CREN